MNPEDLLPIDSVETPANADEVAKCIAECADSNRAIYPLGGTSGLEQGVGPWKEGIGLSTSALTNVIDFPARDLTITVQAGMTMAELARVLKDEQLELPIDVPHANAATVGGVIAANWNGPRRYGLGCVRDHVIGISAVDGRGIAFQGGGRVVKNVAGYDFCKLLTGSFGTLGVITQVTLKLRPLAASRQLLLASCTDWDQVESLLNAQVDTACPLAGLELLSGNALQQWAEVFSTEDSQAPDGSPVAAVTAWVEGTVTESDWIVETLTAEWKSKCDHVATISETDQEARVESLINLPASDDWLIGLKATVLPSGVPGMTQAALQLHPDASVQAHAASGIVLIGFPAPPDCGLDTALTRELTPLAKEFGGAVQVLHNRTNAELTRHSIWGAHPKSQWMEAVKRQFDPNDILNPDRFLYSMV